MTEFQLGVLGVTGPEIDNGLRAFSYCSTIEARLGYFYLRR